MAKKSKKDAISSEIIAKLSANFIKHLKYSSDYKQPRVDSWKRVDDMLANRKIDFGESKVVHIPLGNARGFLRTWLSKIDNSLSFKYMPGEPGDTQKAKRMNAVKEKDQNTGRWNWKDLMGKTQGGSYGRAVYFYTARSPKGVYQSELLNIDCVRFHIDPKSGGMDKENARWLGWGGVELTKDELEEGVKTGEYIQKETEEIIKAGGTSQATDKEQQIINRRYDSITNTGKPGDSEYDEDVFTFYRWFETINNQRYVFLATKSGQIIHCKELEEVWKSGLWPIWTWASNPNMTEFWSLGDVEYQMYIFLGQEKAISQMFENGDRVNNPQKAVAVERVKNLAALKHRSNSIIELDGDAPARDAIHEMPVPSIDTPMIVYDKLESVKDRASGVNPSTQGMAEEDKVAIYEGNMQQIGDLYGLLNKSYSEGYYDFAQLHKNGVYENLTKSMAIKMIGVMGVQMENITKKDVKTETDYDVMIESSNAESQSNVVDKKNKTTFLTAYKGDATVNQKVLFEFGAETAGFTEDETKRMLDQSENATSLVIADANDIFQKLLLGVEVDEYEGADPTFLKEVTDLYWKNRTKIDGIKAQVIESYIEAHLVIVEENMTRKLIAEQSQMGQLGPEVLEGGGKRLGPNGEELQDPSAVSGALDITNNPGAPAVA